jgi:hypothetical protein
VLWPTPAISAFRRWRQKDRQSEDSLGYTARSYLKKIKKQQQSPPKLFLFKIPPPALHNLCFACHAPKACTTPQELHLTELHSLALHNLCFAGHAPKSCTALHNIHSARLCPKCLPSWGPTHTIFILLDHAPHPPKPVKPA